MSSSPGASRIAARTSFDVASIQAVACSQEGLGTAVDPDAVSQAALAACRGDARRRMGTGVTLFLLRLPLVVFGLPALWLQLGRLLPPASVAASVAAERLIQVVVLDEALRAGRTLIDRNQARGRRCPGASLPARVSALDPAAGHAAAIADPAQRGHPARILVLSRQLVS